MTHGSNINILAREAARNGVIDEDAFFERHGVPCDYCGETHDDRGEALRCCSERFEDPRVCTDGGEEPTCPECGTGPDGLLFDPQPSPASNRYICTECEHDWEADTTPKTHVDEDGLRIPRHLREFDQQIVIRTPAGTIQHFGSDPLDAYYSRVKADDFGPVEEFRNPQNPDLAPNKVSIKPQGEAAEVFEVEVKEDIRADGGVPDVPPDTTVYVATTQRGSRHTNVFHTDLDCPRLQSSNNIHEKQRGVLKDTKTHCKFCAGVAETPESDNSTYNALKAADPGDLVTDGGGCPKCGAPTHVEGGCPTCTQCPWSKCGGVF